jgi:DNA-directed RNA polymerase specialized sigma24 family protein
MATRAKRGGDHAGADAVTRGPMSDEELELFYRRIYLPLVRRATWKHKLVREDARDIVQDAFVLALTRLKPTGNPKAWLVQVVDHLSVNYRRRAIRRANLTTKWGLTAQSGPHATESDDPSEG